MLQPRTKPVETNRENAYFFLSSRQKLKTPPNECPISPLPLSKVVWDSMAISIYTLSDLGDLSNLFAISDYIPLISRVFGPYCKLRTEFFPSDLWPKREARGP